MTPEERKRDYDSMWAGFQRTASEALIKAVCSDDPQETVGFAMKAIKAGREGLEGTHNLRQSAMTLSLIDAANGIIYSAQNQVQGGKS